MLTSLKMLDDPDAFTCCTMNFVLLSATTAHLVLSLMNMCNEEEVYRTIIEPYWLPSVFQFFVIVIPLDVLLCNLVALILFPLSCLSRSTVYHWSIGLSFSGIIFAAIWSVRDYANLGSRALLIVDWTRLSMKVASYLIECAKGDQVYTKSSMKSLLYFIYIPNLV